MAVALSGVGSAGKVVSAAGQRHQASCVQALRRTVRSLRLRSCVGSNKFGGTLARCITRFTTSAANKFLMPTPGAGAA
jgi:hypothetical protein